VLNKNGYSDPADIEQCVLEPNGTFYIQGLRPNSSERDQTELMAALNALSAEVKSLRTQLDSRT
jgi:hypothetical protein